MPPCMTWAAGNAASNAAPTRQCQTYSSPGSSNSNLHHWPADTPTPSSKSSHGFCLSKPHSRSNLQYLVPHSFTRLPTDGCPSPGMLLSSTDMVHDSQIPGIHTDKSSMYDMNRDMQPALYWLLEPFFWQECWQRALNSQAPCIQDADQQDDGHESAI